MATSHCGVWMKELTTLREGGDTITESSNTTSTGTIMTAFIYSH